MGWLVPCPIGFLDRFGQGCPQRLGHLLLGPEAGELVGGSGQDDDVSGLHRRGAVPAQHEEGQAGHTGQVGPDECRVPPPGGDGDENEIVTALGFPDRAEPSNGYMAALALAPSRRASTRFMSGAALTPCTSTETRITNATIAQSWSASANSASLRAWAR
jgi:hypothetical protein